MPSKSQNLIVSITKTVFHVDNKFGLVDIDFSTWTVLIILCGQICTLICTHNFEPFEINKLLQKSFYKYATDNQHELSMDNFVYMEMVNFNLKKKP